MSISLIFFKKIAALDFRECSYRTHPSRYATGSLVYTVQTTKDKSFVYALSISFYSNVCFLIHSLTRYTAMKRRQKEWKTPRMRPWAKRTTTCTKKKSDKAQKRSNYIFWRKSKIIIRSLLRRVGVYWLIFRKLKLKQPNHNIVYGRANVHYTDSLWKLLLQVYVSALR